MNSPHFKGIIGGNIGYQILKAIAPRSEVDNHHNDTYNPSCESDEKLLQLFGGDFFDIIKEKTVIDFGCGGGRRGETPGGAVRGL